MAANLKLRAEMFWTDRWLSSSAVHLPMEPKGMLRESFTLAWTLGASLPNDPEWIKRALRCTDDEWKRCWPIVRRYWHANGDGRLVNDTQVEVYARALQSHERASDAARARWDRQAKATLTHDARAHAHKQNGKQASTHMRSDQIRSGSDQSVTTTPRRARATKKRH